MRIAIIITIYNNRDYLTKCLSSIAIQSIVDKCNIYCIIDDGLNYENLFQIYRPIMNIITYTNESNKGHAINRNIGLSLAIKDNMDYIYYLDADDILFGYNSLQILYEHAIYNEADIVRGLMLRYKTLEDIEIINNVNVWTHATLYKLDFLNKHNIHFGSISASEDLVFNFWCNAYYPYIQDIDNIVCVYNYNPNGYNHKNNDAFQYDNMRQQFRNFEYTYQKMKEDSNFTDEQIVRLVREWFMKYYVYINQETDIRKLYDIWRALPIFWNLFSHLLDCPIEEYCKLDIQTGILKYSVTEYIKKIKEGYLPSLC